MVDQCAFCEKPSVSHSEYCSLHKVALANIEAQYANWLGAFGGKLTKEEYFSKLLNLRETGDAVKSLIVRKQQTMVPR
ncbi:MAG: hypothetical protein ACLP5V_02435 [Candidatus Bathyarchaeia archaeon]